MKVFRIQPMFLVFGILVLAMSLKSNEVTPQATAASDEKGAKLHQLRKDKVDVLQLIVTYCENGFKKGEISYQQLCDARLPLRRAQLEACAADAERIAVLEKSLKEAKENEVVVQQIEKVSGEMSKMDVQRARADCLDIEIELERLKSK